MFILFFDRPTYSYLKKEVQYLCIHTRGGLGDAMTVVYSLCESFFVDISMIEVVIIVSLNISEV